LLCDCFLVRSSNHQNEEKEDGSFVRCFHR
jgi:hypothetical protein